MYLLHMGNWYDWHDWAQIFERTSFHSGGYWLLHKVGWSGIVCNVTKKVVVRFIKNHIICLYGVPSKIITDNGSNLNNNMVEALCKHFKIAHHNCSPYRPKMNGAVEAANKNIKKIIQKMVVTYKDWHDILPFALHGYRTSICTSIGAPLSLLFMVWKQCSP